MKRSARLFQKPWGLVPYIFPVNTFCAFESIVSLKRSLSLVNWLQKRFQLLDDELLLLISACRPITAQLLKQARRNCVCFTKDIAKEVFFSCHPWVYSSHATLIFFMEKVYRSVRNNPLRLNVGCFLQCFGLTCLLQARATFLSPENVRSVTPALVLIIHFWSQLYCFAYTQC